MNPKWIGKTRSLLFLLVKWVAGVMISVVLTVVSLSATSTHPEDLVLAPGTVVIGIDCSGSITPNELDMFFAEMAGILEDVKPETLGGDVVRRRCRKSR